MALKTRPCEICKRMIEEERVEVIPETRLCAEHARMIAKHGGEFIVRTGNESIGKVGSLKKNYGGVTMTKKRNTLALAKLRREIEENAET
jgi:hypothetical protein